MSDTFTTAPTINLVGTRCTDGNHLALQRWYADHVHLLLAAPQLQQAQLFRCVQPLAGEPLDYLCAYDFTHHDDFLSFERSEQKAQATALTHAAAGRSSVEVVQRTQYVRWLHRQWPVPYSAHAPGEPWRLVLCAASDAALTRDMQRWLADQTEALRSCAPLLRAQAFVQFDQPAQLFMALDFADGDSQEVWQLWQTILAQPSLLGQACCLTMRWASIARPIQAWLR